MDWQKITDDPTDKKVVGEVLEYLKNKRRKITDNNYISFLKEKVAGKRVLDIGVVEHTLGRIEAEGWKHKIICDNAEYCLGVDILEDKVEYLNSKGFNIKTVDATSDVDLGERFDVVHVGDVIEHVDQPVKMLSFCARHLNDNGIIIMRTPNPFCFDYFLRIFKDKTSTSNLEHICWVTPTQALEMGRRAKINLSNYYVFQRKFFSLSGIKRVVHYILRLKFLHAIMNMIAPDELLTTIYVYEYQKAES